MLGINLGPWANRRRGDAGLPALPLPVGAKLMAFGHSFVQRTAYTRYLAAQTGTGGLQGVTMMPRGPIGIISAIDQRYGIDIFADAANPFQNPATTNAVTGAVQGIGGDRLAYVSAANPGTLARTPYAVGRRPAIIHLEIGTNDVSGGESAATIIARLDQQLSEIRKAGIWCILQTLSYRFDWAAGDARHQVTAQVNDWILAQQGRAGLKVCNSMAIEGTAAADRNLFLADGVHRTEALARLVAVQCLKPILETMVSPGSRYNLDPLQGNLFPFAGLAGTGGTLTSVTGTVASGMNAQRFTGGSTVVASKEVISAGNEKQVFTVTPVNDGTAIHELRFRTISPLTLASLGLVPGDWFEAILPIEFDGWAGWNSGRFFNEIYTGSSFLWETNHMGCMLDRPNHLTMKVQIPTGVGADNLRWSIRPIGVTWESTASGAGTVKIGSPILRKIADPRGAWNLV